jgi:DNA polymerase-1
MQHILFGNNINSVNTAILIKKSSFKHTQLVNSYIKPLINLGFCLNELIAYDLPYQFNNKCSATYAKEYLSELLEELQLIGVTTLLICDSIYFKYLTKKQKVDLFHGYVVPCAIENYEHINCILSPNYQAVLYNPTLQEKINIALTTLNQKNNYVEPGTGIIHSAKYPSTIEDIQVTLNDLHQYSMLTCDVETKGLKFYSCGIATISFAWDKHNGIAFALNRSEGHLKAFKEVKEFLINYKGKFIFHNANFDMKILVYTLWMKSLNDYEGMLEGIEVLCNKFEDTKLITYLATNNTVSTPLKLKLLAQEFAGNYAQDDIKNTDLIPLPELLEYNLIDCLSTWFVYNKYYSKMVKDQQENLYKTFFKPAVKNILQMELCGIPIDPTKVIEVEMELTNIAKEHANALLESPIIKDFHYTYLCELAEDKTNKAKKKVYTIDDPIIKRIKFNPGSGKQLQKLIYEYMGYKVIDFTDTKQPSTDDKTIKKLLFKAKNSEHKAIFENIIGLCKANTIISTFIPALKTAQQLLDGSFRLYGNFNLGGTQSSRLSSSGPNLQNLPSGSKYGKMIKKCFISPKGWIYTGADFASLEDRINALITKDKNKLKVYTDLYDGHSLRAYAYFSNEMPDIIDTVESINSIGKLYPKIRQKSKEPTFLLTYNGGYIGLMNNCGFSEKEAKSIESNYHTMYKESDEWAAKRIQQASIDGYAICAFGLRVRTPLLAQSIGNTSKTPYMVQAEQRSIGNAMTQSYGMLNSRAGIEFQERCITSKHRLNILPVAQIHDALYFLIKDDVEVVKWVNDNLIDCMSWQELPELQHDIVKLGAELDLFWPDWGNSITIPNGVSLNQIKEIANNAKIIVNG